MGCTASVHLKGQKGLDGIVEAAQTKVSQASSELNQQVAQIDGAAATASSMAEDKILQGKGIIEHSKENITPVTGLPSSAGMTSPTKQVNASSNPIVVHVVNSCPSSHLIYQTTLRCRVARMSGRTCVLKSVPPEAHRV
eukprot:9481232-Pyramimonas_sp.AAC.2